jgi:hypothetical protein
MDRLEQAAETLQRSNQADGSGACAMQRDYLSAYLQLRSPSLDVPSVQSLVERNSVIRHAGWAVRWAAVHEHVSSIAAALAGPEEAADGG